MDLLSSILLGVLQGLTEFLPVSSSGHLVIAQQLIPNFIQEGVLFDVFLHAGTVLAVLYYFRKSILKLTPKYLLFLLIGTIPAGLVGFFFSTPIEILFANISVVGFALLFTAVLNFMTDRLKVKKQEISIKNSLLIGVAQAIAIIPGVSRSGSTIFAGTSLGLKREKAAEFSFLLSVPAIVGANVLQFFKYGPDGIGNMGIYIAGFLAAFLSGIFAINLVLKFLLSSRFKIFAFYCFLLGVAVLLL
jgi:undecaprenyl-diphosphatase